MPFRQRTLGAVLVLATLNTTPGLLAADDHNDSLQETVYEQTHDVEAGLLEVDVANVDLEITGGTSDSVAIEVVLASKQIDQARAQWEEMGFRSESWKGVVRIETGSLSNKSLTRDTGFVVTVYVRLPKQFDLGVEANSSDLRVRSVSGTLSIDMEDGDVHLEDVGGPRLNVVLFDGDLYAQRIEGHVSIRTSGGDIQVHDPADRLQVFADDGDIDIHLSRRVEAQLLADGDIRIRAGTDLAAELHLTGAEVTLLGAVDLEGQLARRYVGGALNGGGPELRAKSSSGTVALELPLHCYVDEVCRCCALRHANNAVPHF